MMQQYYIPDHLRMQIPDVMHYTQQEFYEKHELVEAIVSIHYAFYSHKPDFEMGLSLLDYINRKIHRYSDAQIELFKECIRQQDVDYIGCIHTLWTFADLQYFGI